MVLGCGRAQPPPSAPSVELRTPWKILETNMAIKCFEVCSSIFTLNLKSWKGKKLHSIVLLHVGLATFNFDFPKSPKCPIFMICGTSRNVNDPPNPIFLTLDTLDTQNKQDKSQYFWEILLFEISKSQKPKMLEKTRSEQSLRSVLSNLENLDYGINIFQKPCN